MGLLTGVTGLIFKKPLLYLLGASSATFDYANQYITIYLCGTIFVIVFLPVRNVKVHKAAINCEIMVASAAPLTPIPRMKIFGLGLSGFTMSITNSAIQMVNNAVLSVRGGDLYIGAMTVINSIREVVHMPVQGISNSSQPIISFNYGAGEPERVKKA